MRIARTLVLALAAAVAAMALSAGAAFGAHGTGVSASVEGGNACNVSTQNCKIVAHSEAGTETQLVGHLFGFESTDSVCHDEFTGYVGSGGAGHLTSQVLTGTNCTRQACAGEEGEWDAHLAETAANTEVMQIRFCLEQLDGSDDVHCTLDVPVNITGHNSAEWAVSDQRCVSQSGTSARIEVTGHWVAEDAESTDIAITHL